MVAGYAVNSQPPYKTLSYVPDDIKLGHVTVKQADNIRFAEIIALWIDQEVGNFLRTRVYVLSIIDCIRQRPDYLLGGCSFEKARRTQMRALPNLLWEGAIDYSWLVLKFQCGFSRGTGEH